MLSIQASSALKLRGPSLRNDFDDASAETAPAGAGAGAAALGAAAPGGSASLCGSNVNCPSAPIRTDRAVSTSLRLAARGRPVRRLDPEIPTSARGALATT